MTDENGLAERIDLLRKAAPNLPGSEFKIAFCVATSPEGALDETWAQIGEATGFGPRHARRLCRNLLAWRVLASQGGALCINPDPGDWICRPLGVPRATGPVSPPSKSRRKPADLYTDLLGAYDKAFDQEESRRLDAWLAEHGPKRVAATLTRVITSGERPRRLYGYISTLLADTSQPVPDSVAETADPYRVPEGESFVWGEDPRYPGRTVKLPITRGAELGLCPVEVPDAG
jgi:hypothetical protein